MSHGHAEQHGHAHQVRVEDLHIERVQTKCPLCFEQAFGAQGRGYCAECNMTWALQKPSRKELLKDFELRYIMSKVSPFYHRAGCKYIKSISPENLLETEHPTGKPCRCVR